MLRSAWGSASELLWESASELLWGPELVSRSAEAWRWDVEWLWAVWASVPGVWAQIGWRSD